MPQGQTWHNGMAERLCKWWERKESCDLIHCLKCLVGVVMRGVLEKWGGGEKQIHLPWEQSSRKVGCGRLRHRWKSWFKIAAGENLSIGMTPVSGAKPAEAKVVMMVSKVFLQKSFLKWGRGTMLQTKICEHKNRPNNSFFMIKIPMQWFFLWIFSFYVAWNLENKGDGVKPAAVICKRLPNQPGEHVPGGTAGFFEARIQTMEMVI